MCVHKLAVATYDAAEVFCDNCNQRWKVDDILKIAEVAINAAQPSVQRIVGYAGPSEHGTYPGHEVGCICGLCVSTPANR